MGGYNQYNQLFTREDYYREEVDPKDRKVDPETGKEINPHIPQFITKAPWYFKAAESSLDHQRQQKKIKSEPMDIWYARGVKSGTASKGFRKGSCENCGSMSHKLKDCLDRPRKTKAIYSGKNIKEDDVIVNRFDLGFEAKRDRWNGFDANEHLKQVEEWDLLEQERAKIRQEKAKQRIADGLGAESEESDQDDLPQTIELPEGADCVDPSTKTTIKNLRIREDTAKYLLNLDVNSAYYDPKTRSMRGNPLANKEANQTAYSGDNFERWTGDATQMAQLQQFVWDAADIGKDVHLQANPSQAELLFKEFQKRKVQLTESVQGSILEKYGGEEHLNAPPKELLMAQTEHYVEYSQSGKIIKGHEPVKIKSRYLEDVYPQNHTSVWGSYWHEGQWGYDCCHGMLKNSICVGSVSQIQAPNTENSPSNKRKPETIESLTAQHIKNLSKKLKEDEPIKPKSNSVDAIKLMHAGISEEELETYRKQNIHFDDPMNQFKNEDL